MVFFFCGWCGGGDAKLFSRHRPLARLR
jgi:Flp pilus assembly protein protease CpaA